MLRTSRTHSRSVFQATGFGLKFLGLGLSADLGASEYHGSILKMDISSPDVLSVLQHRSTATRVCQVYVTFPSEMAEQKDGLLCALAISPSSTDRHAPRSIFGLGCLGRNG